MNELIKKIKEIITLLEKERGPLLICALFLREEPLQKWDIVISAPWLNPNQLQSYKMISSKLQEILSDSELLQFSRVVLLDQNDPVVTYLQDLKTINNGSFQELEKEELSETFNFSIKRAYLLRSQKLN